MLKIYQIFEVLNRLEIITDDVQIWDHMDQFHNMWKNKSP